MGDVWLFHSLGLHVQVQAYTWAHRVWFDVLLLVHEMIKDDSFSTLASGKEEEEQAKKKKKACSREMFILPVCLSRAA